jgi:hypothetical protein
MIYFRGWLECKASAWENDPALVCRTMQRLSCATGETQIARALRQVFHEHEAVDAVVYIGDHCEDHHDELAGLAQRLGERSMPLYVFHECADHDRRSLNAKPIFRAMAEASGGVYCEFRPDAGDVFARTPVERRRLQCRGDGRRQTGPPAPNTGRPAVTGAVAFADGTARPKERIRDR